MAADESQGCFKKADSLAFLASDKESEQSFLSIILFELDLEGCVFAAGQSLSQKLK